MVRQICLLLIVGTLVLSACGSSSRQPAQPQSDQAMLQATIDVLQATVDASDSPGSAAQSSISLATPATPAIEASPVDPVAGLWASKPTGDYGSEYHVFLDGQDKWFMWLVEDGEIEVPIGGTYESISANTWLLRPGTSGGSEPFTLRISKFGDDVASFSFFFGDLDMTRTHRLDMEVMKNLEGRWYVDRDREFVVEFGAKSMGELFGIVGDYAYGAFDDGTIWLFDISGGAFMSCRVAYVEANAFGLRCPGNQQTGSEFPFWRANQ